MVGPDRNQMLKSDIGDVAGLTLDTPFTDTVSYLRQHPVIPAAAGATIGAARRLEIPPKQGKDDR